MSTSTGTGGGSEQQSTAQLTPNEKFFRRFQHEITDIQEKIERLSSHGSSGGERSDAVEHCLASIARLSDDVNDASSHIPAYDQRTYGEAIKALTAKLHEMRATFAPRPKFAFKGGPVFTAQKNESAISLNDAAALARERRRQLPGYGSDLSNNSSFATTPVHVRSPAPETVEGSDGNGVDETTASEATSSNGHTTARPELSHIRQPSFSQSTSVNISNHDGKHIVLPASAAPATRTSGTLANLSRCVIDMSTPTTTTNITPTTPNTTTTSTSTSTQQQQQQHDQIQSQPFAGGLSLRNISSSVLICGRVAGAVHATRVSNSTLVVTSRQFRMHEARNCDVYLSCASKPVIEDCSGIRFAPLPETYHGHGHGEVGEPGGDSGGNSEGLWRQVQDFKWLHASEPSPNWRVLEPGERVSEKVWRETVPGGPGLGTEDVLAAVGIKR